MRNTYRLEITASCPTDDKPDFYAVKIESARTILVEDIAHRVAEATSGGPVYQEDIAARLARSLNAKVTLIGTHSGIDVESVAP